MCASGHYLLCASGYLSGDKSSTVENSDLIIDQSVVPTEEIGKGAVSYEEADEKEASNIPLAF